MSKRFMIYALLALSLFLCSCTLFSINIGQNLVNGSGKVVSEIRQVSGFDQIALNGQGDVQVLIGDSGTGVPTESLTIEAEDNLLPYIKTRVQAGKLVIDVDNNVNLRPTRKISYTVTLKSLSGLAIGGSGNITADGVQTNKLDLSIPGSGDIRVTNLQAAMLDAHIGGSGSLDLSGQADTASMGIGGSGSINASDLKSASVDASISGSGNIEVWATDSLNCRISGSGDISYYGSPRINQSISGSGHITSRGDK